ncbi:MAG: DNA polymerase IV [Myxococcota bacterium]
MRKIIHVDMDAFYASIEQRDRPHLRGRPVAVGGDPEGRGVVAAASYEARRFGVRSAMSSRVAARLCPSLVFLPAEFGRYRAVSRRLHAILADYSDVIEPLSLDEAFLDVTPDKAGLGTAARAAADIRRRVREELRLTCSAGVAPVKLVAKIASDFRKPDGLTVVPPGKVSTFLAPLPVKALWGVGPATLKRLEPLGLKTIGDVAAQPESRLFALLGSRGPQLWRLARGEDERPVRPDRPRKSRSVEQTFQEDVLDVEALVATLTSQAERVCGGLRQAGERGRTVTLKLRYADFTTLTRASTLSEPTDDPVPVLAAARDMLDRTDAGLRPVRLIGIGLSGFVTDRPSDGPQLALPLATRSYGL